MPQNNRISQIYHNVARKMDYPGEELKFTRLLGEGAFGQVFLAEAYGILEEGVVSLVAVKTAQGKHWTKKSIKMSQNSVYS